MRKRAKPSSGKEYIMKRIEGYPSFVYEYLERKTMYDTRVDWVKDSTLLIAGFGAYRAIIYDNHIILLQDVMSGQIADLRKVYLEFEFPETADYVFNYFLKVVKHTKVITVYLDGFQQYYYDDDREVD